MPPLAFALPSLVAVLAAGSEAELFQLQEKNLRLKAELEQATGTLKVILDKVEAFDRRSCSGGTCSEPRKSPPRPVSPRSPRRRLTHTVGQTNCLPAATPSFGAVSGWETSRGANAFVAAGPGGSGSYYETTSEMSRTVDVSGGSYPWEVSWKLECGGVPAGNGGVGTAHVISFRPLLSSGNCKLTMEDSYGDGWNGAEWSVPSLGLGPFSMPSGSTYTAEVSFNVPPGDTGWIQSTAVPVNSASFRFVYVPPESSPPLSTAAIAQMAVCCSPPAASSRTYVHHSVPHSFADAGACLHTKGPPLTIREDATSTVSATRTPPRDSNHRACCLTRLRRALWQPGLPSLAGATRTWSRCLCRCACKSPIAQTAMSPRSRSAWMPPSRTSSPCRAG